MPSSQTVIAGAARASESQLSGARIVAVVDDGLGGAGLQGGPR